MLAFTTDNFRPAERFDAFNEEFARSVLQLDAMWQRDDGHFHGQIGARFLGPVLCTRMISSPAGFQRGKGHTSDGSIVLGIHLRGRFLLEHSNISWDSIEDFGTLTTDTEPSKGRFDGEALAIRIPPSMLAARLPHGRWWEPTRIRKDTALASLLGTYLSAYLKMPEERDGELGGAVGQHVADLVALAMGAGGDEREAIHAGGLRAARRRAVLERIARDFMDPGLSPQAVAHGAGISERYLRQLLEEQETSFRELVLTQRLERARQMLSGATHGHLRISEIAYEVGFSDLSYFNRSFRRRFGITPSEMRVLG